MKPRTPFHLFPRLWFRLFPGIGMSSRVPVPIAALLVCAAVFRKGVQMMRNNAKP